MRPPPPACTASDRALARPSPPCPPLSYSLLASQPKLKWYSEGVGEDADAVRGQLRDLIAAVVQHMLQPAAHGLAPPKL